MGKGEEVGGSFILPSFLSRSAAYDSIAFPPKWGSVSTKQLPFLDDEYIYFCTIFYFPLDLANIINHYTFSASRFLKTHYPRFSLSFSQD